MTRPLVSVVIPAWNAEDTLAETLASVAAQTYSNLEILVVDDGSTDATVSIAEGFCSKDRRARLIRQGNGGVAAARNAAIGLARGEFIGPLDADDLWHPEKIERQVTRFQTAATDIGLVYSWSRIIDDRARVLAPSTRPRIEGQVLEQHLRWNFIGNGSTPLIRRSIFHDLHYEPALRDAGCQGCEDYLLQLQIASRFGFACVPAFLTGYRLRGRVMSGDTLAMIRSHILMYEILRDGPLPEHRRAIERELGRQLAALGLAQLWRGRIPKSLTSYGKAVALSWRGTATETVRRLVRRARAKPGESALIGRNFADLSPDDV